MAGGLSVSVSTAIAVAALALAGAAPVAAQPAGDRLDALESRITRLEDMNQIERLQRTYGYFVDKQQWVPLAELFTEDATLEIGGKGIFTGKKRVLEYMQTAFGMDGVAYDLLGNHMQFQTIPDISADGATGWMRARAYVMAGAGGGSGGWGLPLYENAYEKGADGKWRISRLTGPFTMYTGWTGWAKRAGNTTWPDKFDPPPDLPPSNVVLMYPSYYIVPFHYPNPVSGTAFMRDRVEVGVYHAPPGTPEQEASLKVGRMVDGTQAIAEPPRD